MSDLDRISTLPLFLASPGDLSRERDLIVECVESVNRAIKVAGLRFDVYRMEEAPPAYGRPQEHLNQFVDRCELFIGLLDSRWGSPTGLYPSGFEEEYRRASARREKQGTPSIWLFRRKTRSGTKTSDSDQKSKVEEFIAAESQNLFYKEFRSKVDLSAQVREYLTQYALQIAAKNADQTDTDTSQPLDSNSISPHEEFLPIATPPSGAALTLRRIHEELKDPLLREAIPNEEASDEVALARFFIGAFAAFSRRFTSELVDVHAANFLFKVRSLLNPSDAEKWLLFRSCLAATKGDNFPGWYWRVNNFSEDRDPLLHLFFLAKFEKNEAIQLHCLQILRSAHVPIDKSKTDLLPLDSEDWQVRQAALEYVAEQGEMGLADLFELESEDKIVNKERLFQRYLLRTSPDLAIEEISKKTQFVAEEIKAEIEIASQRMATSTLRSMLTSDLLDLQKVGAKELRRRKSMRIDESQNLLKSDDRFIRFEACMAAIDLGADLPDKEIEELLADPAQQRYGLESLLLGGKRDEPSLKELAIQNKYQRMSKSDLESALDWYSTAGRSAYKALAITGGLPEGTIERDLQTDFLRVRELSDQRHRAEYGEFGEEYLKKQFVQLSDFITKDFRKAALEAALAKEIKIDLDLIRKALDDTYTLRPTALKLLAKFGTNDDLEILIEEALNSYDKSSIMFAEGSLRITDQPYEVSVRLMGAKSAKVRDLAYRWILTCDDPRRQAFLEGLIDDPNETQRLRGVYSLVHRLAHESLEEFLVAYLKRDSYYYNVVFWLDRIIYAPNVLSGEFIRQLDRSIST